MNIHAYALPQSPRLDKFFNTYTSCIVDPDFDELQHYEVEPMIIKGGLLHRFADDEAIDLYCLENYLDTPKIDEDGKVTAFSEYSMERIQIGWVL